MTIFELDQNTKHFTLTCRLCKNQYDVTDEYTDLSYCEVCAVRIEQFEQDLKEGYYASSN